MNSNEINESPLQRAIRTAQRERARLQNLLNASVSFAEARTDAELGERLVSVAQTGLLATSVSVHRVIDGRFSLVAGLDLVHPFCPADGPPRGECTLSLGRMTMFPAISDAELVAPNIGIRDILTRAGVLAATAAPIINNGESIGQ